MWAVRYHPIIRRLCDPVPIVFQADDPATAEDFYFRFIEREDVDDFYVDLVEVLEDGVVKDYSV